VGTVTADIRLLADLTLAAQRDRGEDLRTAVRPASGRVDLVPAVDDDGLHQALLLRFLTQRGELANLGHPDYGSRLHELVGEPIVQATLNLAKLYALQALQDEPRVTAVTALVVRSRRTDPTRISDPTRIEIDAALQVAGRADPVRLTIPIDLAGGAA
jgi:phage gp46-like protein